MGNKALHIVVLRFRAEWVQVSGACMLLATESNLSSSYLLSTRDIPESSASSRKSFDQNEQHKIIPRKNSVVNLRHAIVSFSLTKKYAAKHGKFTSESGGKGAATSHWRGINRAMRHCKREYPGVICPWSRRCKYRMRYCGDASQLGMLWANQWTTLLFADWFVGRKSTRNVDSGSVTRANGWRKWSISRRGLH